MPSFFCRNKPWSTVLGATVLASAVMLLGGDISHGVQEIKAQLEQQMAQRTSQITVVIGSLLRLPNEHERTLVQGLDACPGQESSFMRTVFGETKNAGKNECIVVTPSTERVQVRVFTSGMPSVVEEWRVSRNQGRISFQRLNGSAVVALTE